MIKNMELEEQAFLGVVPSGVGITLHSC